MWLELPSCLPASYPVCFVCSLQKSGGGSRMSQQSLSTRDGLGISILSGDLILSQRAPFVIGIDSLGCSFCFPRSVAVSWWHGPAISSVIIHYFPPLFRVALESGNCPSLQSSSEGNHTYSYPRNTPPGIVPNSLLGSVYRPKGYLGENAAPRHSASHGLPGPHSLWARRLAQYVHVES